MAKKKKGKSSFIIKVVIAVFLVIIIGGGIWAYDKYKMIYLPNVFLGKNVKQYLYIPSGSSMKDVVNILYENGYVINKSSFEWLAEQKNYKNHVHPGRYLIKTGMSNNKLIDLLRSGEQEPIKLSFNSIRTKEQLARRIADQIEADSLSLVNLLKDNKFLQTKYNLTPENALTLFIPNTYEFYWNTSAEQFLDRMAKEYKVFWTEERKAKAKQIGLSQSEVTTLASIVQAEQSRHNDEKPVIAGLYINRLKKGMRLESDPTLVYALGDFSINRVLNVHKEVSSPYNTYRNSGLPPGPINLPDVSSIDAVLNYKKNDYIFMCAKEDFSGYHNFSNTLEQHNIHAHKYRTALNKRRILK